MNQFETNKFEQKLLELIASMRVAAMEIFFTQEPSCLQAEHEYNAAMDEVKHLKLNQDQFIIIDQAFSSSNHYNTVCTTAAYKFGFADGINLIDEVKRYPTLV